MSYNARSNYLATRPPAASFRIRSQQAFSIIENNRLPNRLAEPGRALSLDSWRNLYQYLNIADAKGKRKLRKDKNLVPINTDYDVYSMGPDGKSVSPLTAKSSKEVIRANDGAYYSIAADY